MKHSFAKKSFLIAGIAAGLFWQGCATSKKAAQLTLQSTPWHFANGIASNQLSQQKTSAAFPVPPAKSSFTVKLKANLQPTDPTKTLLEIPGVLKVTTYKANPADRKMQNYPAYPMPDGTVPVLEASLKLYPKAEEPGRDMVVGIPLAMLKKPFGEHEIALDFSGVRWTLYVDDELVDNDFPLGYPKWEGQNTWKINPALVSNAELFIPGLKPEKVALQTPRTSPEIQYWTPGYHNAWVGDVATLYHNGRYHVFYLFDRRGHASKFGKGGHYFEHISTTDFKTWTEHEAATPIEEQWETFGTGTPFIFDNKLSISYGLHTTRLYPKEQTALPLLWDYYNKNGVTGTVKYDTLSVYPAGSTYSVSEDGISNFHKTKILFHPCENPSVYTDPEGRLRMLANYGAKGTWESKDIAGGWRSINPGFPPGGDCTFFFRWGKYDYVIGGFTGFWTKPAAAPEGDFTDGVKAGLDFYNGMNVPAVSQVKDGRFIIAGWIPIAGWGGALGIHEMIQSPEGRIGTKWMEEIIPQTQSAKAINEGLGIPVTVDKPSFMLTFDVEPGEDVASKLGVLLEGAGSEAQACEMQVSPGAKRAQYGIGKPGSFADAEKSLREGGAPQSVRNYAIENLSHTDKPFTVRMLLKYSDKFGGTLIDTEIAGERTMISFRPNLKINNLTFRNSGLKVKNVKIASLKY
ncbi:glycoside hydrolase family protein [Mucilaginibacter pedocola]|uniref:Glycosyl hydrolase family 32 N-terminal domain-containing protein n=1 Tax=Mucilaginibacter pedocola TaxID=1792845 RepID=A0A1S9PKD9_9SPHI|nr:hypothetical protein [Mucilaginibacter pedocola]OOQ61410.1 hypothetical protein BC343_20800 [Mucilaginibacter pedocola]